MLNETLKKLGITDTKELPKKTQTKIADYNRLVNTPIGNDKEGNYTEKKTERINGLVEDIIFETKLYLKTKGQTPPATPPIAAATPPAPRPLQSPKKPETPAQPVDGGGLLEKLWGW
jgi:hypothetical protein